MTVTIVGTQLGDEGKGGIVDLYGGGADVVARYQGGDNAGHTVVEGGETYKLSLVPSGAVRGKVNVIGNGCVVNPATLFDELDALRERGLDPDVRVARRANVILPYHRILDGIEEKTKDDDAEAVGTTGRGIGPTYEDKVGRRGVRIGDLLDADRLREKLEYVVPKKQRLATVVHDYDLAEAASVDGFAPEDAFDVDALHETYADYGRRLRAEEMTVDAGDFLADRIGAGDELLFESAQGTMLDIDHGNYPFVTSSNPTAGYAATGTGVGPSVVGGGEVVGVVKAYLSRVGSGPMPTELSGDLAEQIREAGGEYGTVTGRPRRVGWLDVPMLRHAARANGLTGLAVNHVDTLAGVETVRVAHAYDLDGETVETIPSTTEAWGHCEPIYREFDGWPDADWAAVATEGYDALPAAAREYLAYLETELDAPVYAVGVGAAREETVVRTDPFA